MTEHTAHDLLVVGGGLVGASLACALGDSGLRIGVIEAMPCRSESPPGYDDRIIALAYGSRRIFEGMGLWSDLAAHTTPIEHIHVSDRGHFGVSRLEASQEGVDALGYVVSARALGEVLHAALNSCDNLELLCPAEVTGLMLQEAAAQVEIQQGGSRRTLQATLVVAADGGRSTVRELLHIDTRQQDYGQTAIIATVTPARPHGNTAFERFTADGPLALLPLAENHCALIWTHPQTRVEETLALDDTAFLARLQQRFGHRLGTFERVGRRSAWPLQRLAAVEQVRHRLTLIGNAAHTLHPVAGQGYNLGLRDVALLAEVIADAHATGRDPGRLETLLPYADGRQADHRATLGLTHGLVTLFSNDLKPLILARNLGLLATDLLPPLKHALCRHSMGLAGRQPRLARGLAL